MDRFTEESFQLPEFRLFDTSTDVVDAVVSNIDADSADDVAVVLDSGSEYSAMLEAALEAAGIPFYGGSGFLDRAEHPWFLQAPRVALRGEGLRFKRPAPIPRPTVSSLGSEQENCRATEIAATPTEPYHHWVTQFRSR